MEVLRQKPFHAMTKGERIAAARAGIIPIVRNDRERQLRYRYNLTLEAYNDLLAAQGGVCASCRQPWHRDLYVDHHHQTREVRALLCPPCNTLVGLIESNATRMAFVLAYVAKHLTNKLTPGANL